MLTPSSPEPRLSPLATPRLRAALERATEELLAAAIPAGHWEGELSSSALSTATAVTALAVAQRATAQTHFAGSIDAGLGWLATHANADGGWGDTTRSQSNLSTTTLVWAAFGANPDAEEKFGGTLARAEQWLSSRVGRLEPASLAAAITALYGDDRTFSIPILTLCALAGRLGQGREAWRHILSLPFELAACPRSWFAALQLPVVSYALPALIAIGQARHFHRPSRNPFARIIRHAVRKRTLRVLTAIQPSNGGFLEAIPLTSFVTLSLAGSGEASHLVVQRGLDFLLKSQRPDGSWPIDTNLATWLTTGAVCALAKGRTTFPGAAPVRAWLLRQQYRRVHPYTGAAPGGWAWTDLPGGVPDADDTSGALLALRHLQPKGVAVQEAAVAGVRWLLEIQNEDGGIPTFCRGWGALPFDRSCADITAHTIQAWQAWQSALPEPFQSRAQQAIERAFLFLFDSQRSDGSWEPLWFGNQWASRDENPTYGTARVLLAFGDESRHPITGPRARLCVARAIGYCLKAQSADGGWSGFPGGPPSVEETALLVEALAHTLGHGGRRASLPRDRIELAMMRGARWLVERIESGQWMEPAPIGFYFAKLWYFERLYPQIFLVSALGRLASFLGDRDGDAPIPKLHSQE